MDGNISSKISVIIPCYNEVKTIIDILDKVEKSLMAPKIINKTSNKSEKKQFQKIQNIKKTLKEYQKFIKNNFDYVGENFTYEARSLHYDNKKNQKGIYGVASKKDIKELKEEGIDTQVLPWFQDKEN